jgi:hypothetical protein
MNIKITKKIGATIVINAGMTITIAEHTAINIITSITAKITIPNRFNTFDLSFHYSFSILHYIM